jgi:hypothetical protein
MRLHESTTLTWENVDRERRVAHVEARFAKNGQLRRTGATRVEALSSKAVAKAFLGHADADVTDTYFLADLDAVRDAVNRAAFAIDGTMLPGVVRFEPRTAHQTAQQAQASGE